MNEGQSRALSRLWVRLLLAFGTVLLCAILFPMLYIRHQTQVELQRYSSSGQSELRQVIAGALAIAYLRDGGWRNVPANAVTAAEYTGQRLIVTDLNGVVIADTNNERVGQQFTGEDGWEATAIDEDAVRQMAGRSGFFPGRPGAARVSSTANTTFGTLWVESANAAALARERTLFSRLQRVTLLSTGLGLLAALLVSLILARLIGRPIEALTQAVRRMGSGDLSQRVPTEGSAETIELARSFNAMATNLATAQHLRQQMVADVAHELRTPLSNIRGYLEAIEDGVVAPDERTLGILREETAQLNGLIDDLQELAQAEAGTLRLDRGPIAPNELLDRALSALRPRASERAITLIDASTPHLPAVLADPQRIGQVLQNLLSNALRHTPATGTIIVAARQETPEWVAISVTDTGSGIAPDDLPQIFERFYRADSSRARATGGSGLGLTIARRLVEAHGGTITATSTPGVGSCFTFTLPVVPTAHPVENTPAIAFNRPVGEQ